MAIARRRIRDVRHDELIGATMRAVARSGFAAVTMQEIAREAGASAASINYYFGAKERLLEATMRRLLGLLRQATLRRLASAQGPRARLDAIVAANFDDALYTREQCAVWMQFWAFAPHVPGLARIQRINRARVRSNFRAALRPLLPEAERETARAALQAWMDGVWLEAAQGAGPLDAEAARAEAAAFLGMLLGR